MDPSISDCLRATWLSSACQTIDSTTHFWRLALPRDFLIDARNYSFPRNAFEKRVPICWRDKNGTRTDLPDWYNGASKSGGIGSNLHCVNDFNLFRVGLVA